MMRRFSLPFLTAALLVVLGFASAARAGVADTLPLPPEITDATAALGSLLKAPAVPAEAKGLAQNQCDQLLAQFNDHWKPLAATYAKVLDMNQQIDAHNRLPHVFAQGQEGALRQYNAQADQLNARKQEYIATMMTQAQDVDAWLQNGNVQRFTTTARKLASGQIVFRKGLAWSQLQALSAGVDPDDIFDGR